MFLKRIFMQNIERVLNGQTQDEKETYANKLRKIAETVFSELRLRDLKWDTDGLDPDVQNAVDRILGKVWQIEDLDELIVLRVFNGKRELIMKAKLFSGDDAKSRIEATRDLLYAEMTTLENAFERTSHVGRDARKKDEERYAKPLLLTERIYQDEDEDVVIHLE